MEKWVVKIGKKQRKIRENGKMGNGEKWREIGVRVGKGSIGTGVKKEELGRNVS